MCVRSPSVAILAHGMGRSLIGLTTFPPAAAAMAAHAAASAMPGGSGGVSDCVGPPVATAAPAAKAAPAAAATSAGARMGGAGMGGGHAGSTPAGATASMDGSYAIGCVGGAAPRGSCAGSRTCKRLRQQVFGSGRGAPGSEVDAGRGVYPVEGGQRKGSGKNSGKTGKRDPRGSIAHAIGAEHEFSDSSSDEEPSPVRPRTTYHIPEVFNASKHMYKLIIEPSVPSTRLNMKFPYIVHFQHVFCLGIMFMSSLDELTRNPH